MYDAIFSLGGNCEPAHQLRRNGVWLNRGPFDWMVTPFDALKKVLNDRGRKLGDNFRTTYGGRYAASADYGCVYFHEFKRDQSGTLLFDANSIAACKSKMTHKWDTLESTCSRRARILFIRFRSYTDEPLDEFAKGKTLCASHINDLCKSLANIFPEIDFQLLFILGNHSENDRLSFDVELDSRVRLETIDLEKGTSGNGSDEDWYNILKSAEIIA